MEIQASCKKRVEASFDAIMVAVPNGGKRSRWAAAQAKREGMRKGFPDTVIIGGLRNRGKVAFVEFKASSSLSTEQRDLLTTLHEAGHQCGVFRSQDTLADKLVDWGWL
ncbi:VRR-NUC domain-containing protein [Novosphingopyxis sp. YJ-S2-01]|uniref:VRR-NUC domain-containing protein n=1 Tax=Novosphingopyxis sp. YJ-S2-01 TaxID=2794021 RepID=UPI0018DB53BE